MKIWAHTLVRNEERWLWYAVTSIVDFVDRVLLWDTGSTDNTLAIIKDLKKRYPSKIYTREVGAVSPDEFTEISQQMVEETHSDWFVILDGDEVWWEDSIKRFVQTIEVKGDGLETIVVPLANCIGDIYRYQDESAGNYEIDGKRGHIGIKGINRRIPGLHFEKPHGMRGLYDSDGKLIQNRTKEKRLHLDAPFMHFTNLPRSSSRQKDLQVPKRDIKFKHELGLSFPRDFYYPEVFFRDRPSIVPSPWPVMDPGFKFRAFFETPLRKIKRKIWKRRVGY